MRKGIFRFMLFFLLAANAFAVSVAPQPPLYGAPYSTPSNSNSYIYAATEGALLEKYIAQAKVIYPWAWPGCIINYTHTGPQSNELNAKVGYYNASGTCGGGNYFWARRLNDGDCPSGYSPSGGVCAPNGDPIPEKECPCDSNSNSEGNPIYPGSGNKVQAEADYDGRYLRFERIYNWSGRPMLLRPRRLVSGPATDYSDAGFWRHNYQSSLSVVTGGGLTTAVVSLPAGNFEFYTLNGTAWESDADVKARLVQQTDPVTQAIYWLRTDANVVERYDAAGRLVSRTWPTGYAVTLTYNAIGRLGTVSDSFNHSLSLTYDTEERLKTLTDPDGKITTYGWSARGQLTSVTRPDASVRSYHYEDATYLDALTGITDEKNVRFATWAYDGSGRAISSEHAGGVEKVTVQYGATIGSATVTDILGGTRARTFEVKNGVVKTTGLTQSGVTGSRGYTYDANGNVATATDNNGVVTKYTYDLSRNLETSRVEAFGTPKERTISTSWHATYRLPLTVTEPGRTTAYTYDGNGNRLTKTITDTTVSPNQSQVWTWTYNGLGQVLTDDGPRTDVSDLTTYTYYDSASPYYGNLQSITNAANHVTQFTAYNANGQVLSQVDPNGVTTTVVYDSRGRMTSRTTNSKTTTYDYDAVGQMTKVTLPDGNWVSYVYDDAHRLTQIQDKAGNKIVYTLDAMSRRTKEEVQDVQGGLGALMEWIKRSLAVNATP